jgi:hypothetical protein
MFDEAVLSSPKESFTPLAPDQFCKLVRKRPGSRLFMKVHGTQLRELTDCKPIEQKVQDAPSISLAEVLKSHRLTSKMKVALAYILARSMWQFYNSDWMNAGWTGENIHFMREPEPISKNEGGSAIYASKPYFCVRFDEADPDFLEFCNLQGKIHRYPRVLALGIILIEIAIGYPLRSNEDSQKSNINADWTRAIYMSEKNENKRKLDYPAYWIAITNCLKQELFASAPYVEGQKPEENRNCLEERRAILYDVIVRPLEMLLTGTGWLKELNRIGPIDPAKSLEQPKRIPSPKISQMQINEQDKLLARWVPLYNVFKSLAFSSNIEKPKELNRMAEKGYAIKRTDASYSRYP